MSSSQTARQARAAQHQRTISKRSERRCARANLAAWESEYHDHESDDEELRTQQHNDLIRAELYSDWDWDTWPYLELPMDYEHQVDALLYCHRVTATIFV